MSGAFFVETLYRGNEGQIVKVCVNITKEIAKEATISLVQSMQPGLKIIDGMY